MRERERERWPRGVALAASAFSWRRAGLSASAGDWWRSRAWRRPHRQLVVTGGRVGGLEWIKQWYGADVVGGGGPHAGGDLLLLLERGVCDVMCVCVCVLVCV